MARTDSKWQTINGGTAIQTIAPAGYDVLINGTSKYLNFNTDVGASGYGFRDNAGTMQFKNAGGGWSNFGAGGTVNSIVAGTGISVDSTDPANPVVSATGGGTGTVTSVTSADANATVATTTTTPVITIVSAPKLATARAINGVNFDGTAAITVTAAAGTLTGTTLNATVVTSSLTSVGTIVNGVWTATKIGLAYGGTNADLSGTGGTSRVLMQTSSGAAITVAQLAASDLSNGTTGSGAVVLAGSPTITTGSFGSSTATTQAPSDNSTKLATTAYVDNALLGQRLKEAVGAATTANLVGTYVNGASGVGATFTYTATGVDTIDGVALTLGMRVLIKNQTSTFQNGIYTVTTAGAIGVAGILTRAIDFDQASDIQTGDSVFVTAGTTLSTTTWSYNAGDNPVMGTDAITFAQASGQGSFSSGNGITITGTSIAIDTSVTVDKNTTQTLTNKTLTSPTLTTPVLGTPSSGTLTNCTGLPIAGLVASTSTAIGVGSIELGHATDTTIARVSAGVVSIEGNNIMTVASTDTVTGVKTMSSIVLPDQGTIRLVTPTTDLKVTGFTTSDYNSGYSSTAIGDLVYLDSSATWQKADANASATTYSGLLGIAVTIAASGAAVTVALPGSFIYSTTGFPTWTIGGPIYMSETAGAMTQTQPSATDSAIRVVGWGVHADKMYFYPSPDYITHA